MQQQSMQARIGEALPPLVESSASVAYLHSRALEVLADLAGLPELPGHDVAFGTLSAESAALCETLPPLPADGSRQFLAELDEVYAKVIRMLATAEDSGSRDVEGSMELPEAATPPVPVIIPLAAVAAPLPIVRPAAAVPAVPEGLLKSRQPSTIRLSKQLPRPRKRTARASLARQVPNTATAATPQGNLGHTVDGSLHQQIAASSVLMHRVESALRRNVRRPDAAVVMTRRALPYSWLKASPFGVVGKLALTLGGSFREWVFTLIVHLSLATGNVVPAEVFRMIPAMPVGWRYLVLIRQISRWLGLNADASPLRMMLWIACPWVFVYSMQKRLNLLLEHAECQPGGRR